MNKKALAWIASAVFTLATGISQVSAQDMNRPAAILSQEELDQMLAPVALYPDSLLAQVLMAATYPLEVVQAARFIDSRPGLQGDALAHAIAPMPWDPSVKSLAQFPSVLAMMNDKLDWTQHLGDAFLSQQANVMDTVQNLRMRAEIAGNLRTNNQQRIIQQDQVIVIEPINPQIIYVPYYNPVVVYGSWWWPQRPPVYWAPPPRYRPPSYNVTISAGIAFGAGVGIARWGYNEARPDWRQHHVLVNNVRINNTHVTNNVTINRQPEIWQHNQRSGQNQRRPDVGNAGRPTPTAQVSNPPPRPTPGPNLPPQHHPETRPEPERHSTPPVVARPQPAATPTQRQERQERPQQHEQRAAPQAHQPPQTAPHQEHKEQARPEAKPKNDERPRRQDDR